MRYVLQAFILCISIIITYLTFSIFTHYADNVMILQISEKEILELEKKRIATIKQNSIDQAKIFFGRPHEAAEYIYFFGRQFANRRAKVIFTSEPAYGEDMRSISKPVHEKIIQHLLKNEKK